MHRGLLIDVFLFDICLNIRTITEIATREFVPGPDNLDRPGTPASF